MDNPNVVVVSRGYNDTEPELVPENMTFCLDGNNPPSNSQQQHQQQQQQQHLTHYHPQQGSFLAMRKGLGSSERSRTDTTAGSSSSSTYGALSSPLTARVKNNQHNCGNSNNFPLDESQGPPGRTNTNVSLQDLYIDADDADGHYDHYSGGQTPPGMTPPTFQPGQIKAAADALKRPLLNGATCPLFGTPPDSLHAQAPQIPSTDATTFASGNHQQQQYRHNDVTGQQQQQKGDNGMISHHQQQHHQHSSSESAPSDTAITNQLGLSISPVPPAFHMEENGSITPPTNRPILYSAIGSLENCSAHSLKSMWNNKQPANHQKNNGFASNFDAANLIAPLHRGSIQQQEQKPRLHNLARGGGGGEASAATNSGSIQGNCSILSSQQANRGSSLSSSSKSDRIQQQGSQENHIPTSTSAKFGDSTSNTTTTTATTTTTRLFSQPPLGGPPQPPPPTKQYQTAFEASFQKIQEKVDAAQNRQQRNKKTPPPTIAPDEQVVVVEKSKSSDEKKVSMPASEATAKRVSSMRRGGQRMADGGGNRQVRTQKSVKIDDASLQRKKRGGGNKADRKKPMELFRPSCDAYTPRMERKKITYKPAEQRTPVVQKMATTMGTLSRPNFRDALRRVAMLIRQHIVKIEHRFNSLPTGGTAATGGGQHHHHRHQDEGLFKMSMKEAFSEEKFATCRYKCTVVRVPMARPGMVFGLKKIRPKYEIPSEEEIYEFAHQLFKTVQLSSECSIVCLIYVERLMERSKVPLLASTWRPIFMCGLLLASKVWQDLSSWNIEFASVYPQFSLDAINKLELQFLRMVKWDLYISSSLYAKYYFALRSLVEKPDFRQRYNRMVGGVDSVAASEALKIQKRTEQVKEEALLQLSRSM